MSRFIAGLVLAGAGVVGAVYGWQRLNSLQSELGKLFGNPDTTGTIMLVGGIIAVIVGVVVMIRK